MKKLFFVLLLFLFACSSANDDKVVSEDSAKVVEDIAEVEEIDKVVEQPELDFSSPFKCVTVVDEFTTTMYVKDEKVRVDTLPADSHAIYTGDMIYSWTGKTGTIIKMSDIEKMAGSVPEELQQPSKDEIVQKAKEPAYKCEPFDSGSDLFEPPSDVEFTDMGEMLEQLQNLNIGDN